MLNADEPTPITIVDDEPAVRQLLADALTKWSFVPQVAESAEEAIALLAERPTPILLTDLHMPGLGGVWLVKEVSRRWPETLSIVLTGSQDVQSAINCLNAGARRYLLKPIELEEVRLALSEAVDVWLNRRERSIRHDQLEAVVSRQTRRARALFLSGIESLFLAIETRDPYISGHSQRVRSYAVALGRAVGLDRKRLRQLSLAAKLHDIGKVAVPEWILQKSGQLTDEERLIVQSHPRIGAQIIRPLVRSRAVLAAVRGHHERIDGTGYPDGLAGAQIPLLARLISVVDCFDALTSARPYRSPLSRIRAIDMLREVAGTQLDSVFVRAFIQLLADRPHLVALRATAGDYSV